MRFPVITSLRAKLLLLIMSTTFAALCLALVTLAVTGHVNFRDRLQRDAVTSAQIIANSSAGALNCDDPLAAEEILAALSADPHFGAAAIYDADGNRFAEYRRQGWRSPP